MLSRLFIAALWSPERKGLTSWLLFVVFVVFIVILLLSHLVSCDRCGTWLFRFLILAVFLTFIKLFHLNVKLYLVRINKYAIKSLLILSVTQVNGLIISNDYNS